MSLEKLKPSLEGIAKGLEVVLQRVNIIEQEIQGLRYYKHRLLTELHQTVN